MEKIDKIYYINLDRRPDRNEHFLKQCSQHNLPIDKIQRYQAIDGDTYNFSSEELELFKNVDYRLQNHYTKVMGNQLSHFYILLDMIKNNYNNVIIFQDDIVLKNKFVYYLNNLMNNIPKNAELINFAFHRFAAYSTSQPYNLNDLNNIVQKKINPEIGLLEKTTNPCSLGYIVTNMGAKNMVEYFYRVGFLRATDWNYNEYLIAKNIFYGSNIVLATGNPSLGSDIFTK